MLVARNAPAVAPLHGARGGRALGHQPAVGAAGRIQPGWVDQEGHAASLEGRRAGVRSRWRRRRRLALAGRAGAKASRVASAMIVSCGLTPSALGTTEPSATCRPVVRRARASSPSTTPCVGARIGARGAERVKGHQLEVARPRALGRDAGRQRQVDLARAGGEEQLAHAREAGAELGEVVVARGRSGSPAARRPTRTRPREVSLTISPNCARLAVVGHRRGVRARRSAAATSPHRRAARRRPRT